MWWGTKERRSGITDRRAHRRGGRRGADSARENTLMLRACPECDAVAVLRSVTRMEGGFLLRYRCAGCAEDVIITIDGENTCGSRTENEGSTE
jgi:hypothetical protein